jgi:hypothetical protein
VNGSALILDAEFGNELIFIRGFMDEKRAAVLFEIMAEYFNRSAIGNTVIDF